MALDIRLSIVSEACEQNVAATERQPSLPVFCESCGGDNLLATVVTWLSTSEISSGSPWTKKGNSRWVLITAVPVLRSDLGTLPFFTRNIQLII